MSKIDHHPFSAHEHVSSASRARSVVPELVIRQGKHGPFLGCLPIPLDYIRSPHALGRDIEKVLEGSSCPDCGHPLAIKKVVTVCLWDVPSTRPVSISNPFRRVTIPKSSARSVAKVIW